MTLLVTLAALGFLLGLDLAWGERWSVRGLSALARLARLDLPAPDPSVPRSYGWRIAGTMLAAFCVFLLLFTLVFRAATRGGAGA